MATTTERYTIGTLSEWSTTSSIGGRGARTLSSAEISAPTILTSVPESKMSGYCRQEEGLPHGHCGLCKYNAFCRREDGFCQSHSHCLGGNARTGRRRTAISAEAFGAAEPCEGIQAYHKCKDTRRFLLDALINAGPPLREWFKDMDEDFLEQVILSGRGWHASEGDEVILEGEQLGDTAPGLYILESGELHVYKQSPSEQSPGKLAKTYARKGDTFGELAVLYGAPRAATVVAVGDCYLWSIDRHTMTSLKRKNMEVRRLRQHDLLQRVELLAPLGCAERAQVIDSLKPAFFNEGEVIIKQGDEGSRFFLLEEGTAKAWKDGEVVACYGPESFFGELALLNNQPRAASVIAVTDCKCAYLERESFDRLLGPLASLQEHAGAGRYKAISPRSRSSRRPAGGSSTWSTQSAPRSEVWTSGTYTASRGSCKKSQEEHPQRTPSTDPRSPPRSGSVAGSRCSREELFEESPRKLGSGSRPSRRSDGNTVHWDGCEELMEEAPRMSRSGARSSHQPGGSPASQGRGEDLLEERTEQSPSNGPRSSRRSGGSASFLSCESLAEDQEPTRRAVKALPLRPSIMMTTQLEEGEELLKENPRRSHLPPSRTSHVATLQTPEFIGTAPGTPPPLDYYMPKSERLCFDSSSEEDELGVAEREVPGPCRHRGAEAVPDAAELHRAVLQASETQDAVMPEAFKPPARSSRFAAPMAAMKAIMRMHRNSPSKVSSPTDADAPCTL